MKIETERLILRKPMLKDTANLVENGNDKETTYFTYYLPFPFNESEAKRIILEMKTNKDLFRFAIFLKSEKKVIGLLDLYNLKKVEGKIKIGYWIGKDYRGKGLATESVKAGIGFAREKLNVRKIVAKVLINNDSSKKLLERLDFKKVKITPGDKFLEGKKVDTISYELDF